jgi:hypothetical protein
MAPTVADYRTRNLLILRAPAIDFPPVTAEVASSSLVVPAILLKDSQLGRCPIWVRLGYDSFTFSLPVVLSAIQIPNLSGVLFIANKLALLIAIAILGKPGFNHLKRLLFGMLRKLGPPQQVGRRRYDLGLILIMVPVLMTRVEPYAAVLSPESVYWFLEDLPLELLLLIGLFLVGGEFWNKVRALIRHAAKVEIVAEAPAAPV